MSNKVFALVDCNNFYASCERIFKPKWRDKPIVILSNNDGCIIARSNEAKDLGIEMGEPLFKAKATIQQHNMIVRSANFELYGDISDRVMSVLEESAVDIEIYSVDEAFLLLNNQEDYFLQAKKIRDKVFRYTGIPVSIGIARTKTLAKLANKLAKDESRSGISDSGIKLLCDEPNLENILEKFPVAEIWGIGYGHEKFLRRYGIKNALQLKRANQSWIKDHMKITGLRTVMELNDIACRDLETNLIERQRKTIISSRSFSSSIKDYDELKKAIANYISIAAGKLRRENLLAQGISVFIKSTIKKQHDDYKNYEEYFLNGYQHKLRKESCAIDLKEATSYTPDLIKHADLILKDLYTKDYEYKKAGVMLYGLTKNDNRQLNLFSNNKNTEEKEKVIKLIDSINDTQGTNTLYFASTQIQEGEPQSWRGKQGHKSPCYTTRWEDLLPIGNENN